MLPSLRVAGTANPGFRVGNAIFDLGHDYEEAEITYAGIVDGVPVKLQFDINTFEQATDETALVERGEANLEGLGVQAEKLRSGSRTLAGDAGDEWLGAFDNDGQRLHGFYAVTRTRAPSRRSPKLLVGMATGDEEASSGAVMADEIAIGLWDQVLTSLRKRPE